MSDATHTIPTTFTAAGHAFTQQPGSLVWLAPDGYRFWLGEQLPDERWTMGADAGQDNPTFAFGIFDGPEEALAAFEGMVAVR